MITVKNKHHPGASGEYIGRGSPLGNPYSHMEKTAASFKVSSRTEAIVKYRVWLADKIKSNDQTVCNELNRLVHILQDKGELNLLCFCKPQPCHGDVIKDIIETALKEQ